MSGHLSPDATFQLRQRTSNTCLYVFLFVIGTFSFFFIIVLPVGVITGLPIVAFFILIMGISLVNWVFEKHFLADVVITTSQDRFHMEIVKSGLHIKEATFTYPWAMLQDFRFYYVRNGPDLRVRWTDGSVQHFVRSGDINLLIEYLERRFPDRRYHFLF